MGDYRCLDLRKKGSERVRESSCMKYYLNLEFEGFKFAVPDFCACSVDVFSKRLVAAYKRPLDFSRGNQISKSL